MLYVYLGCFPLFYVFAVELEANYEVNGIISLTDIDNFDVFGFYVNASGLRFFSCLSKILLL